ncbi:unnamed protein product [Didymodactylos carnosus]|uniref:Uncharacterized protein n=1 Tax=Didymodactylos carnosus TaxID=1234261 RepID=A0A814LXL3_9BILA|nr:unnamed protein product [Didymodactylos carnosus]CAF3838726.1 unnamed protein product [Didymodactylos carnosus]
MKNYSQSPRYSPIPVRGHSDLYSVKNDRPDLIHSSRTIDQAQHQRKKLYKKSPSGSRSPSPPTDYHKSSCVPSSHNDDEYVYTTRQSLQTTIEPKQSIMSKAQTRENSKVSNTSSSSTFKPSNPGDPNVAYIPDLPLENDQNQELENMIRQCLKVKHKQEVIDIKCNTQLGVGIVRLKNKEEKDHLINVLRRIILDTKVDTIIKFSSDLELVSYVVIESTNSNDLPTPEDVAHRWVHLYKTHHPLACEQLSVQFPNIFRIVTNSLDELIKAMSVKEFAISGQLATVYFRADCCFFEELPRNASLDRLRQAINYQLS